MTARAFVIDGDDTLWLTEPLYDTARREMSQLVVEAGLDAGAWERLERHIDLANVARFGLSRDRFPTSCVEAYQALARSSGMKLDPILERRIREAARVALFASAALSPYASEFVRDLSRLGPCILLTRGDTEIQRRRISESGLEAHFSRIEIVSKKTPRTFRQILSMMDVDPSEGWSVGNSFRSDIAPALEVGMRVILVASHCWEYEHCAPTSLPEGVDYTLNLFEALRRIKDALASPRSLVLANVSH